MHNIFTRNIFGRLKYTYSYSKTVFNTTLFVPLHKYRLFFASRSPTTTTELIAKIFFFAFYTAAN